MDNQTAVAAPSAAQESPAPSFEMPRSGTPEYTEWRTSGKLPDKSQPNTAESATADAPKETTPGPEKAEHAPDAGAGKSTQESRRKLDAEARIKQLTDELKTVKGELDEVRRPKTTQADPSPAKPAEPSQPQNYKEWREKFKPSQWINEYLAAHPEEQYEDGSAAMSDFLDDVRGHFRANEQARQSQAKELAEKIEAGKAIYGGDFGEVADAAAGAIANSRDLPQLVGQRIVRSEYLPHLVYTIAGKPENLASFIALAKSDQFRAIDHIVLTESLIKEELAKGSAIGRNDQGQFAPKSAKPEPPAKRGPESAPEPPLEIGSRGSGPMDESARALQTIERGDPSGKATRAWLEAENAKQIRRLRGM